MMEEKKVFAKDIKNDDGIVSVFLCAQKNVLVGKTGLPYITLQLVDKTGTVDGKVWDNVEALSAQFDEADYVKVKARATTYNGKIQLRVSNIRSVPDEEINPEDFLPTSPFDTEVMFRELREIFENLANPHIRRLLLSFFEDEDFVARYRRTPAAKGIHHPYLGGLLEHTLSLAKVARLLCGHYPEVDESMLLAGVFFHDIGKTRELSYDRTLGYTDEGRLVGHITLGVEILNERLRELPDFPADLKMVLTHMILAHHGLLEFGSPKRPKTIEAQVLSLIDDMDARINSFRTILEEEAVDKRWSNYQRLYERYLYRWQGEDSIREEKTISKTESEEPDSRFSADTPKHRPTEKAGKSNGFRNTIRIPGMEEDGAKPEEADTNRGSMELPLWKK